MRTISLAAVILLFGVILLINGCASISNPGRANRPSEAISDKVDRTPLFVDLVWCVGSWVFIPGSTGSFLGLIGLGGTIYDFTTENIYKTKPNYQEKYPDEQ